MVIKFRKLELKKFWGWITERQSIWYKRNVMKKKAPWTKDKILQTYKFTNVFRQQDRVTKEWTERFIHILFRGKKMTDGDLLFQCAQFRLFNWPETYDALFYGLHKWNCLKAQKILEQREKEGHKIFTGAYIVSNSNRTDPKRQVICEALEFLYDGRTKEGIKKGKKPNRDRYAKLIVKHRKMEKAVEVLSRVPTIGGFVGYEIACDLRFTRLLADALDKNSWANPGPGAKRGINRLMTGFAKTAGKKPDYIKAMRMLLEMYDDRIGDNPHFKGAEWPFEMREIEHSLCEYDKWSRVKNGEGRPRSKFIAKKPRDTFEGT